MTTLYSPAFDLERMMFRTEIGHGLFVPWLAQQFGVPIISFLWAAFIAHISQPVIAILFDPVTALPLTRHFAWRQES